MYLSFRASDGEMGFLSLLQVRVDKSGFQSSKGKAEKKTYTGQRNTKINQVEPHTGEIKVFSFLWLCAN